MKEQGSITPRCREIKVKRTVTLLERDGFCNWIEKNNINLNTNLFISSLF
jgi:hypothetical protein